MSKYILTEWEVNGYNDSDFMCTYYDDMINELRAHQFGTTRFAAPTMVSFNKDGVSSVEVDGERLLLPTKEIVEKARLKLEDFIFHNLQSTDRRRVFNPAVDELYEGLLLRTKEEARNQVRQTIPCHKCNVTGKWVNPRNVEDVRECIYCDGRTFTFGIKLKNEKGKLQYQVVPANSVGKVIALKSFGQFYKGGYNKPNEHNTNVELEREDKIIFRASLKNLRLDRECQSDAVLREKAVKYSFEYNFSSISKCAWDTHNFAKNVVHAK